MFTDTHCHLAAPELWCRLPEILHQAQHAGVNQFIVPSATDDDWQHVLSLRQQSEIFAIALGLHPWFLSEQTPTQLAKLDQLLHQHPQIWVGEIGLDFHNKQQPETQKRQQQAIFEQQLCLAKQHQRPIILHNVKATATIVSIIQKVGFQEGGIAHAFSGSLEEAQLLIKHGFKIGLGSLLLNPHAKKVRHLAEKLPASSLLLETDSPYMQPENSNTPARLIEIATTVAQLRHLDLPQLAQICEKNLEQWR